MTARKFVSTFVLAALAIALSIAAAGAGSQPRVASGNAVKGQATFNGLGSITGARISGIVSGISRLTDGTYEIIWLTPLDDYTVSVVCDPAFSPSIKIVSKSSTSFQVMIADSTNASPTDVNGVQVTIFSREGWSDL